MLASALPLDRPNEGRKETELNGSARTLGKGRAKTYVDLHLLVQAVVHDKTVRHPNTVRFHGMSSDIGVVSDVRVVEVGHLFLFHYSVRAQRVKRCKGRHDGGCKRLDLVAVELCGDSQGRMVKIRGMREEKKLRK
jgi:hypothetical protein